MALHPLAHARQAIQRAFVELATAGRADVQQQIAALARRVDEHQQKLIDALPGVLVAEVAPGAGESLAGFPHNALPVDLDPLAHHELLRGLDVPAALDIHQVETVVDDDAGLQFAHHLDEVLAVPVGAALAHLPRLGGGVAEVEEHHVHLAVVGEQLAHLAAQVLGIFGLVARLVQLRAVGMAAHRVQVVDDELRVMPVDDRMVEADFHVLAAESIGHRPDEVFAAGGVGGVVIGQRRVEQAEAVVVLGGDDEVLHARPGGGFRPDLGVVQVRVEVLEIPVVDVIGDLLDMLHPFVPGGEGVDAPVDEETETILLEPGCVTDGGPDDVHELLLLRTWCLSLGARRGGAPRTGCGISSRGVGIPAP